MGQGLSNADGHSARSGHASRQGVLGLIGEPLPAYRPRNAVAQRCRRPHELAWPDRVRPVRCSWPRPARAPPAGPQLSPPNRGGGPGSGAPNVNYTLDLDAAATTLEDALEGSDGTLQRVRPKSAAGRPQIRTPRVAAGLSRVACSSPTPRRRELEQRLVVGHTWYE